MIVAVVLAAVLMVAVVVLVAVAVSDGLAVGAAEVAGRRRRLRRADRDVELVGLTHRVRHPGRRREDQRAAVVERGTRDDEGRTAGVSDDVAVRLRKVRRHRRGRRFGRCAVRRTDGSADGAAAAGCGVARHRDIELVRRLVLRIRGRERLRVDAQLEVEDAAGFGEPERKEVGEGRRRGDDRASRMAGRPGAAPYRREARGSLTAARGQGRCEDERKTKGRNAVKAGSMHAEGSFRIERWRIRRARTSLRYSRKVSPSDSVKESPGQD